MYAEITDMIFTSKKFVVNVSKIVTFRSIHWSIWQKIPMYKLYSYTLCNNFLSGYEMFGDICRFLKENLESCFTKSSPVTVIR